jgi:hypothetical protein
MRRVVMQANADGSIYLTGWDLEKKNSYTNAEHGD